MRVQREIAVSMDKCLICNNDTKILNDSQIKVTYSVCDKCGFIHKNKEHHVDKEEEHRQYTLHNNSFNSEGYVNIFKKLIKNYITPLHDKGNILEYGSGPGPVLKELLIKEGHTVYDFDPFFNENKEYQNHQYNLITSTEVVEHFHNPLNEFEHLASLLEPSGYLLIMTRLRTATLDEFLNWWYRRDTTHVSFYTMESLIIIAKKFSLKIVKTNDINVIIFQKI